MISGRSIRLRLIVMLTSTILLVWLVVLVLVYLVAEHEVEEVFDANLAQNAHILQALLLHEVEEELNTAEKVREVTEELGASGLSAYPRLAALLRQYTSKEGKEQVELFKAAQDAGAVSAALAQVRAAAEGDTNLLPLMKSALLAGATLGQIADALRAVFGEHRAGN